MSKVHFLGKCPGCGDEHLAIECKKPTFLTPTVTKSFCDHCESSVLLKVMLPKNRESRNQLSYFSMKIAPSAKLLEMVATQEAKKKEEKTEVVNESKP